MTLRIRKAPTGALEAAGVDTSGDGWGARLAKLIPAEALGLYGAAVAIVPQVAGNFTQSARTAFLWGIAVVCLAVSAAIRWKATSAAGRGPQMLAIAISLVSFLVWLLALGAPASPIALPPGFGFVGALIAVIWATLASYFYRGDPG